MKAVSAGRRLGSFAAVLATLAAVAAGPGSGQAMLATAEPGQECVAEAIAIDTEAWVCLGDTLTWNQGTDSAPDWRVKQIAAREARITLTDWVYDDDTWCENGTRCAALGQKSADGNVYNAKVKGNAAFGDQSGVLGSFDVIWRSFLKGPRVGWRLHLVHDSGQWVHPAQFVAWERKENSLSPDGSHCYAELADFDPVLTIRPAARHTFSPSKTGETMCSKAKTKKETWHDDLDGYFEAGGNSYYAAMLHSAHWESWKASDGSVKSKMLRAWDY